jgi:hypothetical protein
MITVRRRLRLFVAAWLIFESASLSALVARDCCREHRAESGTPDSSASTTAAERRCHERAAATHCPVHAEAPPACPMHDDPASTSAASSVPDDGRCVMRGVCNGPMTALAALMTQNGVLPDSTNLTFDDDTSLAASATDLHPILRSSSPDTPPPKLVFHTA